MEKHGIRGSIVIARCYCGLPSVLRVWSEDGNMVLLSDSNQYDRLLAGLDALSPVGFLKQDVFVYDPEAAEAIANGSVDGCGSFAFEARA